MKRVFQKCTVKPNSDIKVYRVRRKQLQRYDKMTGIHVTDHQNDNHLIPLSHFALCLPPTSDWMYMYLYFQNVSGITQ